LIPKYVIVIGIIFIFLINSTDTILLIIMGVESYSIGNTPELTMKGLLVMALLIIGILFLINLLLKLSRSILRITSDIFLYINGYLDSQTYLISYQNDLQQNFQSQFEGINLSKKLIFITHSLGTLITLDFFKNIKDKHSDSDILFITMG